MTRPAFLVLAATAALAASASVTASAEQVVSTQSLCGKRADIVSALSKEFQEAPMAMGMVDRSAVVEVFVSSEGTWTIIASHTDGSSCIVSSGEGWQSQTLVAGKDA